MNIKMIKIIYFKWNYITKVVKKIEILLQL